MRKRLRPALLGALCLALLTAASPAMPDSPVADAAQHGDLEAVRSLLRDGQDVNAAQGDGMTALHWAARVGDTEMTGVLLHAGANVHATTRLGGYTPLIMAAQLGNAPVIAQLLKAGVDPERATTTGATPLHFAAASGDVDAIGVLLDAGADANARESAAGQTPLMFAAAQNRAAAIRLLVQRGAAIDAASAVVDVPELSTRDGDLRRQRNQRLALERESQQPATQPQRAAAAQAESRAGGRGQAQVAESSAAELQGRERAEARTAVTRLDSAGASSSDEQRTVSDSAAAELQGREAESSGEDVREYSYTDLVSAMGGLTPLLHAARQGHTESVHALVEAGADVNTVSAGDGTSPLLIASINGRFDIGMYLLEHGADPNVASHANVTPLYGALNVHWAPHAFYPQPTTRHERTTHIDFLKALLDAGADPNARVAMKVWYTGYNFDQSGVDEIGATAFWRAAQSSDVHAMRLLVEHGAEPDIWTKVPAGRQRGGAGSGVDYPEPPVAPGGPAVSPLHAATGSGYDGNYHRNAPVGWLPAVKYLVDELGFDVNVPDHRGNTPLHNAAFRGDNEMILYLVEKGADVMAITRAGQTTVDMANGPIQRLQPFPETIKLL
ncbi:MAG TPA: ankyrin repeat domain-containing protein, partial [Longimicrobiales bacterium]|nr:ankyrin repeat domain-containing protein [Longimicrobiales bacterium]